MISLLAILATWYITKLYYTKNITFNMAEDDAVKVICASCSRYYWVGKENQRSPYYCNVCK